VRQLPEVVQAGGAAGLFLDGAERGKQQRGEDGDDGDDDEQFDQGETPLLRWRWIPHGTAKLT
jgi:hypothetical protein